MNNKVLLNIVKDTNQKLLAISKKYRPWDRECYNKTAMKSLLYTYYRSYSLVYNI